MKPVEKQTVMKTGQINFQLNKKKIKILHLKYIFSNPQINGNDIRESMQFCWSTFVPNGIYFSIKGQKMKIKIIRRKTHLFDTIDFAQKIINKHTHTHTPPPWLPITM